MTILITVAVLLLLLIALVFFLNVRVFLKYNTETGKFHVSLRVLFVTVDIYPRKPKPEKTGKQKKKKAKKKRKLQHNQDYKKAEQHAKRVSDGEKIPVSHKVHEFTELLKMISIKLRELVPGVFGAITLEVRKLYISVGGEDAAAAAVGYGAVCGTLQTLFAVENQCKKIKFGEDIYVGVDYISGKIKADFEISLKIRAIKVLAALYRAEDAYYSYKAGLDD